MTRSQNIDARTLPLESTIMNSPPEALSPSPSTPTSGSPSPDEASLLPISTTGAGGNSTTHSPQPHVSISPSQQAKRRLPTSSSSVFAGREGRENKSRRRDRDRDNDIRECRDREDRSRQGGAWEALRGGEVAGTSRMKEDLVDLSMVEYVRDSTRPMPSSLPVCADPSL